MNYEEFEAVSSEKIKEVLQGGDFSDISELEDALIEIRNAQEEVEHVKALKKRREEHYNAQIKKMEERERILREAVGRCMSSVDKKTLKYPGVGSISRKTVKGKWNIKDEQALVAHCERLGIGSDAYEEVVKINKTKMNKVLDDLEKNSNVPECAEREDDKESLSVTIEREKTNKAVSVTAENAESQAVISGGSREDFDGIDI